jgi:hypothetical protein
MTFSRAEMSDAPLYWVDASKTGRHFSGFFRIYDRVVRQKPGSACWSKSDFLVREFWAWPRLMYSLNAAEYLLPRFMSPMSLRSCLKNQVRINRLLSWRFGSSFCQIRPDSYGSPRNFVVSFIILTIRSSSSTIGNFIPVWLRTFGWVGNG